MPGGYRHGKRREPTTSVPAPAGPRYIEDRVGALEAQFAGLLKITLGIIEQEEEAVRRDLAALELRKRSFNVEPTNQDEKAMGSIAGSGGRGHG
jgi:hypothetical protein